MVQVNINLRTPIARQELTDFVVPVLVDFLAPGAFEPQESQSADLAIDAPQAAELSQRDPQLDDQEETEFLVGRLWAERLDWFYAEECGFSVSDVCDARSGTWVQVLETLCHTGGQHFRKDLNLDANFVSDVVFLHETLIHPEVLDRIAIMDAAIRGISNENSLVLMHHEQTQPHHLEDWECHELGFKKIARSNLLLRDNHYRYLFGDGYTAGRLLQLTATIEHETWLLESWEELMLDHPSL